MVIAFLQVDHPKWRNTFALVEGGGGATTLVQSMAKTKSI
jgi:hypothetical protein